VRGQFDQLQASQETLQTLASDTGGKAFTDSNDFGGASHRSFRDTSAYYLLGYSSTNDVKDGRFRRITVRVKRPDLRVEHRNGYYAERDFAHTGRQDRERELQEQLASPVSSTDIPVFVSAGWFRLAADRYYVPLSVAIPGDAGSRHRRDLDVLGAVRDEQGRPVGRIRQTLKLAAESGGSDRCSISRGSRCRRDAFRPRWWCATTPTGRWARSRPASSCRICGARRSRSAR
jgi:hypothetical protein